VPDRPRVLLVVASVAGGIAAHVKSLALDLHGLDVDVTVMAPGSSLRAMALDAGPVATVAAPVGSPSPRAWWSVRRQLRRLASEASVVHGHGLRAAAAPGVPRSTPLVATWHNAPLGGGARRRLHELLERRVARRATVVLAASADLAERARRAGARDVRLVLVGSPVSEPATRDRARIRRSLGVAPDTTLVLAVGRLHRQKRFDVLIEAAAGWRSGSAAAHQVLIAGDGPLRDVLAGQIAESRAPVRLLGLRDDVADLMAAADVVVLCSEWEARALVAQEALRAGVPLVCTDVGGLPDLVGDAALLVPVGDAMALRDAVGLIRADPILRTGMIVRGRERAAGWPTSVQLAADANRLYLDLMSRSGANRS
jgi:glycosyltransferase involved in cell wall biosynthesis